MAFRVEIVTPEQVAFEGEAEELQAPGWLGEFGVLPEHAPMLALSRPGVVTLYGGRRKPAENDEAQKKEEPHTIRLLVGAGFAEVGGDGVTLLVELCEDIDAIDVAAASKDLEAALAALAAAEPGTAAWTQAQRDVELARARVAAVA